MGRDKEFKVGKAFTLGLKEITFLKVECERTGSKASTLINKWIREKMNGHREEIHKTRGPEAYCLICSGYREYIRSGKFDEWICDGCGDDKKSDYIKDLMRRSGKY